MATTSLTHATKTKQTFAKLVVERLRPAVDAGRYAVKRTLGDRLVVEATVYKDGHDLVAGRVRYRGPGDDRWRTAPMAYERDFDRLRGEITPDRLGRWTFTVEAWTDRFGSWRTELEKKVAVELDVDLELVEGAMLVTEAARAARGVARSELEDAAAVLRGTERPQAARIRVALDPALFDAIQRHLPPADLTEHPWSSSAVVDAPVAAFAAWYEMFPRSQAARPGVHGTFGDAERQLPRLAELGFDVVYLPPIHPIGRTHRKGKNNTLTPGPDDPGSPWAIGGPEGGHTAVHPDLGTVQDFERFVHRANALGLEVALDYALQCSPDHPWVLEHPDWFHVRPDGSIKYAENPPKRYEDIYPLNFWCENYPALWAACRDILLFWIERGVRTFRVDNPHTKPFAFWAWMIAEIQRDHPDTVFLSEAFTRPARMQGLAKIGFTQSYTYFTWRNTPWEVREYLTELTQSEPAEYFRPNFFVNTPDILHEYLQTGGRPAFRVRLVLAATLSPLYGMYSGFELCDNMPARRGSEEYLNSEKYEIRTRDWNAPGNLNDEIARINRIRREHPALQRLTNVTFYESENPEILFYGKHAPDDEILVTVNLDPHHPQATMVHVPVEALGLGHDVPYQVEDLLTGARYTWQGSRNFVRLDPTQQVAHVFRVPRPPAASEGA
jgi:starch synthase (maltosyl-transferring)